MNPPPINLLRLSFASYAEFLSYFVRHEELLSQIWLWHETVGDREGSIQLPGICDICSCQTSFCAMPVPTSDGDRFSHRVRWKAESRCGCGITNIDRMVLRTLFDGELGRVYHVGHHSRFAAWLRERNLDLTTSQYEKARKPGEISGDIRYEDLTQLSFSDGEFDSVICMEVLEHIPDYRQALREVARVLKPKGRALLTFPWLGTTTYSHLTRAEVMPDGSIHHILPPEYHGDPAGQDGILSLRAFGWEILDEMKGLGFSEVMAKFIFGPLYGYMILLDPVIVGVR